MTDPDPLLLWRKVLGVNGYLACDPGDPLGRQLNALARWYRTSGMTLRELCEPGYAALRGEAPSPFFRVPRRDA